MLHRVPAVALQQRIRIPRGQVQKILQRRRFRLPDMLSDRPPILSRQRRQQSSKVLFRVLPGLRAIEQGTDPVQQIVQLRIPGIQIRPGHGSIIHNRRKGPQ